MKIILKFFMTLDALCIALCLILHGFNFVGIPSHYFGSINQLFYCLGGYWLIQGFSSYYIAGRLYPGLEMSDLMEAKNRICPTWARNINLILFWYFVIILLSSMINGYSSKATVDGIRLTPSDIRLRSAFFMGGYSAVIVFVYSLIHFEDSDRPGKK